MTSSEWLTVTEARGLLGVSKGRMAKLIAEGILPAQRGTLDTRVKLVRRADVEWLKAQPQGGKRGPKSLAVA